MAQVRCSDCESAIAVIECCKTPFCLLHAHCTRHALHPSMWRVINKAEHARTLGSVDSIRSAAITQLELDLKAAEDDLAAAATKTPLQSSESHAQFQPVRALQRPGERAAAAVTSGKKRSRPIPITAAVAPPTPPAPALSPPNDAADCDPFARRETVSENIWKRTRPLQTSDTVDEACPSTAQLPCFASTAASSGTAALAATSAPLPLEGTRASVTKLIKDTLISACKADTAASASATAPAAALQVTVDARPWDAVDGRTSSLSELAAETLATAIEGAVFAAFGRDCDSRGYRDRSRTLAHALRDPRNGRLRSVICSGSLAPTVLAELSVEALGNPRVRANAEAIKMRSTRESDRTATDGGWVPCAYTCTTCGAVDSEYREQGSGAADSRKAEVRERVEVEVRSLCFVIMWPSLLSSPDMGVVDSV